MYVVFIVVVERDGKKRSHNRQAWRSKSRRSPAPIDFTTSFTHCSLLHPTLRSFAQNKLFLQDKPLPGGVLDPETQADSFSSLPVSLLPPRLLLTTPRDPTAPNPDSPKAIDSRHDKHRGRSTICNL